MSEWKQERVRARLARQGAEQRETVPAKKKRVEREWLIVSIRRKDCALYVRAADGTWVHRHENDPPVLSVRSRHRTEADARRELEKHERLYRAYFIAHCAVYERMRPLWT